MIEGAAIVAALWAGSLVGYFVGVRVRADEVRAAALGMLGAALRAQAVTLDEAAARVIASERSRHQAEIRRLIEITAEFVQDDLAHQTHEGRAVAASQALYAAQEAHHGR